jgi:hypothetical protein
MRLLVRGKWLKDQRRWSMVVPLPDSEKQGKRVVEEEQRKQPLGKPQVVPLRPRTGKRP